MSYEITFDEKGSGKPVLFIHGLGGSSIFWDYQVEHLSDQYNVLTVDLFGHGKSKKNRPSNMTISDTAEAIGNELKRRGLSNVNIVGHGMGGLVGVDVALNDPTMVDKLVLVDTKTKQEKRHIGFILLFLMRLNYKEYIVEVYKHLAKDKKLLEEILRTALTTNNYAFRCYSKDILGSDYSEKVRSLDANKISLIITATLAKRSHKLESVKEKFGYDHISDSRVHHFTDSRHYVMREKKHEFNEKLKEILPF